MITDSKLRKLAVNPRTILAAALLAVPLVACSGDDDSEDVDAMAPLDLAISDTISPDSGIDATATTPDSGDNCPTKWSGPCQIFCDKVAECDPQEPKQDTCVADCCADLPSWTTPCQDLFAGYTDCLAQHSCVELESPFPHAGGACAAQGAPIESSCHN